MKQNYNVAPLVIGGAGATIGTWAILAIAIGIIILLIGGTLTVKLWSALSSFKGNTLMIFLMLVAVLFFYLMFFRRRR